MLLDQVGGVVSGTSSLCSSNNQARNPSTSRRIGIFFNKVGRKRRTSGRLNVIELLNNLTETGLDKLQSTDPSVGLDTIHKHLIRLFIL